MRVPERPGLLTGPFRDRVLGWVALSESDSCDAPTLGEKRNGLGQTATRPGLRDDGGDEDTAGPGGTVVQTITYGYDVYGNVVAKAVNGTAVAKYAYEITDPSPGFTASVHTLWAEYDGSAVVVARYLTHGEETVAVVTVTGVSWLLADRLGSTRLVADATGAVVSTIEYTAFGGIASQTGTDAQSGNVLFTGGWLDRDVGLYQMHWRSYDPTSGQFRRR